MATLSEEKIIAIIKAYNEIGTYSGVAKELGCSAATVKKYVMLKDNYNYNIKNDNLVVFDMEIPSIQEIDWGGKEYFNDLVELSNEEKEEIKELWREL